MNQSSISVIVPTKNSALTLGRCLASLRNQRVEVELIVVDNFSVDGTLDIAREMADVVLQAGPERSAQRNIGAAAATRNYLAFIDSDMVVDSMVMGEAIELLEHGASAVVIPEVSVGVGFWAAVRAFERSYYLGRDGVEAARVFKRSVFEMVGEFDVGMNAGEDWDLTLRVRNVGQIEHTSAYIEHLEGQLTLRAAVSKKRGYADGLANFVQKNGFRTFVDALRRPYFRYPARIVKHPLLFTGLIILKGLEALAVAPKLVLCIFRSWIGGMT